MPSSLAHTHRPTLTHTQKALVHMLTLLWTLHCTHPLYEAEDYPTIGNQTQPYMGLIQIHFGPFIMCIQPSNIEATCQRGGWANALSRLTHSHILVSGAARMSVAVSPRLSARLHRGIASERGCANVLVATRTEIEARRVI